MKHRFAKSLFSFLLLVTIVLTLFACAKTEPDKKNDNLIKIGIINNDPNESGYRVANDADMRKTFTVENGYDASFSYNLNNSKQIEYAKKYIADGVDYLLISAADTTGWEETLTMARDAGVKVILFDRKIDVSEDLYEASIISDMDEEGRTASEWLKNQNLDEYKIIHIQGVMGTAAQRGRSGALQNYASENGWKIVKEASCDWQADKAEALVEGVIKSGADFNVIYAENDDMAKGAVAALDAAHITHGVGKDVIIIGFDCNKWALEELLGQEWNYDGQCNPFQAQTVHEVIQKLENNESLPSKTIILEEKGFDATTITPEDIEKYGI